MNLKTTLPNLQALDIQNADTTFPGGNQEWYSSKWQQQAGCGPTSCANLLWYLAQTNKNYAPLCAHDAGQKSGFIKLMEDIWDYVTPGNMGVSSADIFINGAKEYAHTKNIDLLGNSIVVPRIYGGARQYSEVHAFISHALQRALPVAFLNLSNGTLSNLDSWHWVTLVSISGEEALMYDQGKALSVDLRRWLASSLMGGAFVTLEVAA